MGLGEDGWFVFPQPCFVPLFRMVQHLSVLLRAFQRYFQRTYPYQIKGKPEKIAGNEDREACSIAIMKREERPDR